MASEDFVWSVKNGDLEAVKTFLKTNSVHQQQEGRPALHFAADYGHTEVIACLLDAGAKIDEKDKHGITPLLAAIWEGHTSAVELLVKRGADINGKNPDGESYYSCAETDEMKALLKKLKCE